MKIEFPKTLFITGIGTDIGKSYATGWLANFISGQGESVITQKFVQTGNDEYSEDIECHRKIMNLTMQDVDLDHTTAPVIFTYPASPHLAAAIDGREIDFDAIEASTCKLASLYDHVLVEGAGGVMVPLTRDMLTIDYIAEKKLPSVLVVTGQLGSINHALLSLYAMKNHGIEIFAVLYNPYFDTDKTICDETRKYLNYILKRDFPNTLFLLMESQES